MVTVGGNTIRGVRKIRDITREHINASRKNLSNPIKFEQYRALSALDTARPVV